MADQQNRRRKKKKGGDGGNDSSAKDWASDYGWSLAFLNGHPALKKIFDKAIDQGWSAQRFVAEIQDTPWFKQHSDSWRQATYLQATDPKTYGQRTGQIAEQIKNAAGALGIEVSPKLLKQWSEQALRFGWTDVQINNHLASQVDIMGKHDTVGGQLASTQDGLMQFAAQNGVTINQKTMQGWLRAVVRGDSTFEEYRQYITKMAVAAHPNWSKELQSGMTLSDIAEPYRNTMAQVLEMNPADIDLNGSLLRNALSFKDDKTGEFKSMTMYDFEDRLRSDPRWLKTDNAKQQMMDTGSGILRMFGLSG